LTKSLFDINTIYAIVLNKFVYLFLRTKLGLWSIAFNNRIWALAFFKVVQRDNVRLFFPLAFFTE
jgi:hypothetical protein